MIYTNEVIINSPIDKVVRLFDNTENMYEWMEGVQSHDFIKGEPGAVGSTMNMHFKVGKNSFDILETILENNLPEVFAATYETKYSKNTNSISFVKVDEISTKYFVETKVETRGVMMKVMTFCMPNMFKKQSQKYLDSFKDFVEKN